MANKLRIVLFLFCVCLPLLLSACGGGGGTSSPAPTETPTPPTPAPTKAVVVLATTGTLPAGLNIGGIQTDISYSINKGLMITDSNVVASGIASGATLYPNTATPGKVTLGNLTLTGAGFPVGEFATLTFTIDPSQSVLASDFAVEPGSTSIGASDNAATDLGDQISVIIKEVRFE